MILDGEQYRIIVESSPNMIWRAGTDTLCNYFNKTWLDFTGRTMEQEAGNGWAEGVHVEDFDDCLKTYLGSFEKRQPFEMEYRLKRHDGEWRWINDRGTPYYTDNGEFGGYIGSCIDVSEMVEGRNMRSLAENDGLTGIFNRQHFEELAEREFLKAKRFQTELCVVMIDIDEFKMINDNYGHFTGDLVLKEVAKVLSEHVREVDILGRYGGDEFIILLSNTTRDEAEILVYRLKNEIGKITISHENSELAVSASFGIYRMEDEENLSKVIIGADKELYEKKRLRHKMMQA